MPWSPKLRPPRKKLYLGAIEAAALRPDGVVPGRAAEQQLDDRVVTRGQIGVLAGGARPDSSRARRTLRAAGLADWNASSVATNTP